MKNYQELNIVEIDNKHLGNLIKVDVAISRCFGNNNIEVLEINKDNIKIIKL